MSARAVMVAVLALGVLAGDIILVRQEPTLLIGLASLAALLACAPLVHAACDAPLRWQRWLAGVPVLAAQALGIVLAFTVLYAHLSDPLASALALFVVAPVLLVWVVALAVADTHDSGGEAGNDDEGGGGGDPDRPDPEGPDDTDRILWDLIERTRVSA